MADSLLAPEEIMLPPSPPEPQEPSSGRNSPNQIQEEALSPSATAAPITMSFPASPYVPPPQTHSPLPRPHFRSRSIAGFPSAPLMTRAHSSPGLDSRGRYVFSGSPGRQRSPHDASVRRHSPLRLPFDDTSYTNSSSLDISEPIFEHPEIQHTPRKPNIRLDVTPTSPTVSGTIHNTFPRIARRRPSSPLHPGTANGSTSQGNSSPTSIQSSPLSIPSKFNESYPSYSFSSASSMPSTPSSIRSRSPSISSLETIPDIPDAEAAAIEADQIARLKVAADKADADAAASSDVSRGTSGGYASPLGNPRSSLAGSRADKRKRWSVCGAEGRQDLDLETIWED